MLQTERSEMPFSAGWGYASDITVITVAPHSWTWKTQVNQLMPAETESGTSFRGRMGPCSAVSTCSFQVPKYYKTCLRTIGA